MLEHLSRCGAMPMADAFGDGHALAGQQDLRGLTSDLIVPFAGNGQQGLARPMMDMPVRVSAIYEGYIGHQDLALR